MLSDDNDSVADEIDENDDDVSMMMMMMMMMMMSISMFINIYIDINSAFLSIHRAERGVCIIIGNS